MSDLERPIANVRDPHGPQARLEKFSFHLLNNGAYPAVDTLEGRVVKVESRQVEKYADLCGRIQELERKVADLRFLAGMVVLAVSVAVAAQLSQAVLGEENTRSVALVVGIGLLVLVPLRAIYRLLRFKPKGRNSVNE